MCSWRSRAAGVAGMVALLVTVSLAHGADKVWTDPADATLPPEFKIQGEYVGAIEGGGKLGAQVIALGGGALQAVLLPGGLPGDGWDGQNKILLDGKLDGGAVNFKAVSGKKSYLAQSPAEFSATRKNPSPGQKHYTATARGESLTGKTEEGQSFALKKMVRESPTLGAKPPEGAKVLFDGTGTSALRGGRLDEKTKFLNTDGHDVFTAEKFLDYTMHVEFMEPFRPQARGQGRGNSGFYQTDLYEVQILDSFGLDGADNECGGIYKLFEPQVNMCLPPLTWQTYDVDFTSAKTDAAGKKTANARVTVKLNGVVVQDNVEIKEKTAGSRNDPEGTPGPVRLQGHGNPLQFRNIWIVPKSAT